MSGSDKSFLVLIALIIGGCVSDNAVDNWYKLGNAKAEQYQR